MKPPLKLLLSRLGHTPENHRRSNSSSPSKCLRKGSRGGKAPDERQLMNEWNIKIYAGVMAGIMIFFILAYRVQFLTRKWFSSRKSRRRSKFWIFRNLTRYVKMSPVQDSTDRFKKRQSFLTPTFPRVPFCRPCYSHLPVLRHQPHILLHQSRVQ